MESTTIKKVKDIVINALNKFWITLQTKIVQKTDIVNSLTNLSTKAPLSAKQGYVLKGLVDECKKNIGDVFSEESTYSIGDYVIYENTLYKFTADKAAGAWDGTKANAVKVADELSSLNGNMPKIFNGYVNFKITDREQPISVTFPQAFSEIPSVIGMVKRSGYANQTFWTLTAVNKTSATFYVTTGGNTANNADCTLYWIAVGR